MATFALIRSSKSSAAMQAALRVMDRKKKKKKATSGSPAARDSENDFRFLALAWQERAEC